MLTPILWDVEQFRNQVQDLKSLAPTFPSIHVEDKGQILWATTWVPFEFEGAKYIRHVVESIHPTKQVTVTNLLNRVNEMAQLTIRHAIPCQFDELL